ncbi:nickel-dependent lactate racemase [Clostridium aestuarii]|uniref:Nickel-dependent lactate racemase n=1 Tax=Clostridium aestuarii TaxID=338193 RepID=A0ABT4D3K9_9CLOT|nr:nickel-dependent lactate racemase [Clostridium aestuarii]MCY6484628.1 nickel-dependent lactate racemase [Clostridium aestuarii]
MINIKIPYYKNYLDLKVSQNNLKAVLTSNGKSYKPKYSEKELVINALKNPINSESLKKLAKGKEKVVIVTSDHTRAVPSKITLPLILKEVREGNSQAKIIILVATGLHRSTTKEEMVNMFGKDIVENENIIVHDVNKTEEMQYIGKLPSGEEFSVNRLAVEADLLVTEGFIEPHFFAGFSGGRKSILPGISSRETVNANHSSRAIAHPLAKTGILDGNPIHEDMIYAAKAVGVDFILNVALNEEKDIIAAFAGDVNDAHRKGCKFVDELSKAERVTADIVITSNGGYPLDQNLYQAPKAIASAVECLGKDGVIVMVASCIDGVGGTNFERLMLKGSPDELIDILLKIPDKETISQQWCVQKFAYILQEYKLILVTNYLDHELIRKMNMIPASNLDEAMKIAYSIKGNNASVTVIPDGVSVIVH